MSVTTIVMLVAFVVAPVYLIMLYRNIKRNIKDRAHYLHTHRNYDIWK